MKKLLLLILLCLYPQISLAQVSQKTPNFGLIVPCVGGDPGCASTGEPNYGPMIQQDLYMIDTGMTTLGLTCNDGELPLWSKTKFSICGYSKTVAARVTVATKPVVPVAGEIVVVTDALNGTTCTLAGGVSNNTCQYDSGTKSWVVIGGGGGGGGGFDGILSGTNKGQTLVVHDGSTLSPAGTGAITANAYSGVLPLANGGTNAINAANARTNLSVFSKAENQSGAGLVCSSATASDTYTCTMTPTLTAYTTGMIVNFRATAAANVGAASLAIDGLAAISILKYDGSALADNDIVTNAWYALTYDGTNFRLPKVIAGLSAEADTMATVFARGKQVTTGANSFANRWGVGDGGAGCGTYVDGSTGPQFVCWPASGVENDLDHNERLNAGKKKEILNSAASPIFTVTESTGAVTNMVMNAEGNGNVITLPLTKEFAFAGCNNATSAPIWDLPTSDAATTACVTGSNTQKGVLNFTTGQSAQISWLLPPGLTGTADFSLLWSSAQTSSTGTWALTGVCSATDGTVTDDPAFGAFWAPSQDTSPGTANRIKLTNGTAVTWPASCSGGKYLHLKLAWTAGTATSFNAIELQITYRRAL